jgi:hypothetical protein
MPVFWHAAREASVIRIESVTDFWVDFTADSFITGVQQWQYATMACQGRGRRILTI